MIMPAVTASPTWPVFSGGNAGVIGLRAMDGGRPHRLGMSRLWADPMVRNSLFLIGSSGVQAAVGFVFWIVVARLYTPADVGRASSLISAVSLISYLALFGLSTTLVRYLPTAPNRNELITAGLCLVTASGTVIGLLYVFALPILAPRLAFVEQRPLLAVGFVLLAAAAAVNVLTDSVFISSRQAKYTAVTDGGIGGLAKIGSAIALSAGGAYSIFLASAGSLAMAAASSLVIMLVSMRWRPLPAGIFRTLRPVLMFSGASYASSLLMLAPNLVVPLILLDRLGAPAAAYYFVAFQLALLLMTAIYAVEQTLMTEGSQAEVDWPDLLRRSRRLVLALFLPLCAVLVLVAHWVLLAFGRTYSEHATICLMLIAAGTVPIGANNWLQTVLRLSGRLRATVWTSAVYGAAICGLAWFLAPHGLTALAAAWPLGGIVAAAAAAVACRGLLRTRVRGSLAGRQEYGPTKYRASQGSGRTESAMGNSRAHSH